MTGFCRLAAAVLATLVVVGAAACAWAQGAAGGGVDPMHLMMRIQRDPYDARAWNAYGIEQARRGDVWGAVRTWRQALQWNPRYVHFYNNIGSALRRLGQPRYALAWYEASLRLMPAFFTWYNVGLLYEEQRQFDQAVRAYQAALALHPEYADARARLRALLPGQAPAAALAALPMPSLTGTARADTMPRRDLTSGDAAAGSVVAGSGEMGTANQVLGDGVQVAQAPLPEQPPASTRKPKRRQKPEHVGSDVTAGEVGAHDGTGGAPVRPPQAVLSSSGGSAVGGPVFLTFDGGADADGIPAILAALQARGLTVTFFLTGQFVKNYPELARDIQARGHEIANHSMTHPNMSSWDAERIAANLKDAADTMVRVLGRPPVPFFRFPFGAQNRRVEAIVASLGYHPVYWDIDTLDWKEPPVASIIDKVRRRIKPMAVVLMHCGSKNGARALPTILDDLMSRGFTPRKLSTLGPTELAALP